MKHWVKMRLRDVLDVSRERIEPLNHPKTLFNYVGLEDIEGNTGNLLPYQPTPGADIKSTKNVFQSGQILYGKLRPYLNKVYLAHEKGICSTDIYVINARQQLIRSDFVAYYLRSPAVLEAVSRGMAGANLPRINEESLLSIPVAVPPLAEQARIAGLLDEVGELQKLRAQADSASVALIPALFQELFGDPATNPKGWPVRPAGELMSACDYGTSQKANEEGRGIAVLRMGNVQTTGELDLIDLKAVELPDAELAKQKLEDGDVLFNRTNSRDLVGKTGMWDGRMPAVAASYFIRVRFDRNIELPQHFTAFMNLPFMKRRLAEMARGAVGQANINAKELKAIRVPVPPLALQGQFSQRVMEIHTLESKQASSRQRLDDLYQSMLHGAFSGEL